MTEIKYTYVTDPSVLATIANEINDAPVIGFDTETTGLDPHSSRLRLFTVNTLKGIYLIDLFKTGTLGPVLDAFRAPRKCVKVGQNLKFDQKFAFKEFDLELTYPFDTFKASNIVYNGLRACKHDLYSIYSRELDMNNHAQDQGASNWAESELSEAQLKYAAEDVFYLPFLRDRFIEHFNRLGLRDIAALEFNAIAPEASMELNGINLDKGKWLDLYKNNLQERDRLADVLRAALPNPHTQLAFPGFEIPFNLESPDQMLKSLRLLGVGDRWRSLAGKMEYELETTGEIELAAFASKHPVIKQLLLFREYAQCCKTFGKGYLDNINAKTGRIHCSFYAFTGAGRYSCVAPWTPVRTSEGVYPIERVRPGDTVWTHKNRWRKVLAFIGQGLQSTFEVTFSTGLTLTCTGDHRLLLDDGRWVPVEELVVGNALQLSPGNAPISVESITAGPRVYVYDLTVEEDESYETWGVFSHNCSKPNLQQIPRKKEFRACFTAPAGKKLSIFDYGQIELRIVAEVSGDEELIRAYNNGEDIHTKTASIVNNVPQDQVTKLQRQSSKPINFGFIYGMSADKLVKYARTGYGVEISPKEAKDFRKRYFESYAGVARWHDEVFSEEFRKQGMTRTILNRLRHLNPTDFNEFTNSPVQGSAADGLKKALRCVYNRIKSYGSRVRLSHMVHDEIILEVDDDPILLEEICGKEGHHHAGMIEGMQGILTKVPATAEGGSASSWAEK
jgi:DNA polymerase I-like protein with 3'-5' exonuclease and polymerase domains